MGTFGHGFELVILALYCLIGVIGIGGTIFWIWALVDCLSNEPAQEKNKVAWVLLIVLTHFVGALIYLFVRRPRRRQIFGR